MNTKNRKPNLRIRHANEFVFDKWFVKGERFWYHGLKRRRIGPVDDDKVLAIDKTIGSWWKSGAC